MAWRDGEKQELQKQQKGRMCEGREVNKMIDRQDVMDTDCRANKTQKQKVAMYRKAVLWAVQYTCFPGDWYFQ